MPLTALLSIVTDHGEIVETLHENSDVSKLLVAVAYQLAAVGESDFSEMRLDIVNATRSRDDMRLRRSRPFKEACC